MHLYRIPRSAHIGRDIPRNGSNAFPILLKINNLLGTIFYVSLDWSRIQMNNSNFKMKQFNFPGLYTESNHHFKHCSGFIH